MALTAPQKFEIGNVYKNGNGKLFVAVTENKALSFTSQGKPVIRTLKASLSIFREGASVNSLCEEWGIALETLDHWTAHYRGPLAEPKAHPRGSRRRKAAEELFWRKLRTAHLLS
jgi:hypothetical protein